MTLTKDFEKIVEALPRNCQQLPPTIYDIAREAKVGIGTVSRVFNDHPSVSKGTRERILRIAHRLNYRPHPYARGLARKRTNSVMAVIPFFTTFFFMEILQGVQTKLSELDIDLILVGVNHPDQIEEALKHHVHRSRVDGILFFSMQLPEAYVSLPASHRLPVVLVDAQHSRFDSLAVDNQEGAYQATRHLIALGHKRIGMLNANLESQPARERLLGFRKAMQDAGLPLDPTFVKSSKTPLLDGFTSEAGHGVMEQFIALGKQMPTAFFISSDIQAAGALEALAEHRVRCPQDVSIVGFDDIELATHLGLTTMRQPLFHMGQLAAEAMLARLERPAKEVSHSMFVPQLVVRKTSRALNPRSHSSRAAVP